MSDKHLLQDESGRPKAYRPVFVIAVSQKSFPAKPSTRFIAVCRKPVNIVVPSSKQLGFRTSSVGYLLGLSLWECVFEMQQASLKKDHTEIKGAVQNWRFLVIWESILALASLAPQLSGSAWNNPERLRLAAEGDMVVMQ
jgi:hypothetical protein